MTFDADSIKIAWILLGIACSALFGFIDTTERKVFRTIAFGILGGCINYIVVAVYDVSSHLPKHGFKSKEEAVNDFLLSKKTNDELGYSIYKEYGQEEAKLIMDSILSEELSISKKSGYLVWKSLISSAKNNVKIVNLMTDGWKSFIDSNEVQSKAIKNGVFIERINLYMNDTHRKDLLDVACDQSTNVSGLKLREASFHELSEKNDFTSILELRDDFGSVSFLLVDDRYLIIYFLDETKDKKYAVTGSRFTTNSKKIKKASNTYNKIISHSTELKSPCQSKVVTQ